MVDLALERKARNMTQEHLAIQSGLSRSYIALLETTDKVPSVCSAKKLAQALSISWQDFFDESEV